jgi:hypothetical protein
MDKATMKWWVDYANRLERELGELREELGHYQIELHRQKENSEEVERLLAENKKWKSIASNFYYKRDNAAKQYEKEVRNGNR